MKCGFCKKEGVDMRHVRGHVRRPARVDKRDAHHDARRQLIADLRAASAGIDEGWYAVGKRLLYEVYHTDDGARIRMADGSPVPGGLEAELQAYRRIGTNLQAAMLGYGQATGRCGHCNEPLPNAAARARGITPICAMEMGWADVVRAG